MVGANVSAFTEAGSAPAGANIQDTVPPHGSRRGLRNCRPCRGCVPLCLMAVDSLARNSYLHFLSPGSTIAVIGLYERWLGLDKDSRSRWRFYRRSAARHWHISQEESLGWVYRRELRVASKVG